MSDARSIEARINLANVLFRQGRFERTQRQYERCLEIDPSFQAAWYGLAQAQIAQEQYLEAQRSLVQLLELDDEDWQGWLLYGNVSEKLGQRERARESWQKAAHKLSPVKGLAEEALERTRREGP